MKTIRILFSTIIFLAFLLVGRWIGSHASLPSIHLSLPNQDFVNRLSPHNSGDRRHYLLVHVDRLHETAQLKALWWIKNEPGAPLVVIPVFPSLLPSTPQDAALLETFNLEGNSQVLKLSTDFQEILATRNIPWDTYVILDDTAVNAILELVGSHMRLIESDVTAPDDVFQSTDTNDHPIVPANPTTYMQEMCYRAFQVSQFIELEPIGALNPKHILTDQDPKEWLSDWMVILSRENNRYCVYPLFDQLVFSH